MYLSTQHRSKNIQSRYYFWVTGKLDYYLVKSWVCLWSLDQSNYWCLFFFICSPNHRAFYKSTFNLSFPFENIVTTVSLLIMSSLHKAILVPYLQMWGLRASELSYGRIPPVSHWTWLELNYPLGVCTCLRRQNGNYHNSSSQCFSPRYGYTYFTHAISTTLWNSFVGCILVEIGC